MVITTTPTVEDKKIIRYLGIVTGVALVGRDMNELRGDSVIKEMQEQAIKLGANAVVGVDLDIIPNGITFLCIANGTAVIVE
jgi:uncharacterized protein YbjQ (UPF0145 family)